MPFATLIVPAKALLLECFTRGLDAHTLVGFVCAVTFTKGVTSRNKRDRLGVIHGHSTKGLTNIMCGKSRIRVSVWSLRIHIDQSHLYGSKWVIQFAIACVTLISEHHFLGPPINKIRLPVVRATASKSKGLKAHILHGNVASKNHKIGPANTGPVRLFDGPQKTPRFVEVSVIGPTIKRFKTLLPTSRSAATIGNAISTRTVPSHANK